MAVPHDCECLGGARLQTDRKRACSQIRYLRRWWEHLVDFLPYIVIETVAVRPRRADARSRAHSWHGAGSDTPLDEALWTPAEWRDAKCVWWGNHGTEAEALQALGLRE
jgi:hypothetical protein